MPTQAFPITTNPLNRQPEPPQNFVNFAPQSCGLNNQQARQQTQPYTLATNIGLSLIQQDGIQSLQQRTPLPNQSQMNKIARRRNTIIDFNSIVQQLSQNELDILTLLDNPNAVNASNQDLARRLSLSHANGVSITAEQPYPNPIELSPQEQQQSPPSAAPTFKGLRVRPIEQLLAKPKTSNSDSGQTMRLLSTNQPRSNGTFSNIISQGHLLPMQLQQRPIIRAQTATTNSVSANSSPLQINQNQKNVQLKLLVPPKCSTRRNSVAVEFISLANKAPQGLDTSTTIGATTISRVTKNGSQNALNNEQIVVTNRSFNIAGLQRNRTDIFSVGNRAENTTAVSQQNNLRNQVNATNALCGPENVAGTQFQANASIKLPSANTAVKTATVSTQNILGNQKTQQVNATIMLRRPMKVVGTQLQANANINKLNASTAEKTATVNTQNTLGNQVTVNLTNVLRAPMKVVETQSQAIGNIKLPSPNVAEKTAIVNTLNVLGNQVTKNATNGVFKIPISTAERVPSMSTEKSKAFTFTIKNVRSLFDQTIDLNAPSHSQLKGISDKPASVTQNKINKRRSTVCEPSILFSQKTMMQPEENTPAGQTRQVEKAADNSVLNKIKARRLTMADQIPKTFHWIVPQSKDNKKTDDAAEQAESALKSTSFNKIKERRVTFTEQIRRALDTRVLQPKNNMTPGTARELEKKTKTPEIPKVLEMTLLQQPKDNNTLDAVKKAEKDAKIPQINKIRKRRFTMIEPSPVSLQRTMLQPKDNNTPDASEQAEKHVKTPELNKIKKRRLTMMQPSPEAIQRTLPQPTKNKAEDSQNSTASQSAVSQPEAEKVAESKKSNDKPVVSLESRRRAIINSAFTSAVKPSPSGVVIAMTEKKISSLCSTPNTVEAAAKVKAKVNDQLPKRAKLLDELPKSKRSRFSALNSPETAVKKKRRQTISLDRDYVTLLSDNEDNAENREDNGSRKKDMNVVFDSLKSKAASPATPSNQTKSQKDAATASPPTKKKKLSTNDDAKQKSTTVEHNTIPVEKLNEDTDSLFYELLGSCQKIDSSVQMSELTDRVLADVYFAIDERIKNMQYFRYLLITTHENILKQPHQVYVYLEPLVKEICQRSSYHENNNKIAKLFQEVKNFKLDKNSSKKLSNKSKKSLSLAQETKDPAAPIDNDELLDEGIESKSVMKYVGSDVNVSKLVNELNVLQKEIHELEEAEVDWDAPEEDTPYIRAAKLKEKAASIIKKICGNTKDIVVNQKPFVFNETAYPEINRVIEGLSGGDLPDRTDMLDIFKRCNTEYNYGLSKEHIKSLSEDTFKKVIELLKARRLKEFNRNLRCYEEAEYDPADYDEVLDKKLKENAKIAETAFERIVNKYARDQGIQKTRNEINKRAAQSKCVFYNLCDDSDDDSTDGDEEDDDENVDEDEEHANVTCANLNDLFITIESSGSGSDSDDDDDVDNDNAVAVNDANKKQQEPIENVRDTDSVRTGRNIQPIIDCPPDNSIDDNIAIRNEAFICVSDDNDDDDFEPRKTKKKTNAIATVSNACNQAKKNQTATAAPKSSRLPKPVKKTAAAPTKIYQRTINSFTVTTHAPAEKIVAVIELSDEEM